MMDVPLPAKEAKTAEELAAMIHEDLVKWMAALRPG
jgi:hypothetical protein